MLPHSVYVYNKNKDLIPYLVWSFPFIPEFFNSLLTFWQLALFLPYKYSLSLAIRSHLFVVFISPEYVWNFHARTGFWEALCCFFKFIKPNELGSDNFRNQEYIFGRGRSCLYFSTFSLFFALPDLYFGFVSRFIFQGRAYSKDISLSLSLPAHKITFHIYLKLILLFSKKLPVL